MRAPVTLWRGTGRLDIALCGVVQVSNRIVLGDEKWARKTSRQNRRRASSLTRRPLLSGGLGQLDIAFYGVGRVVNSNLI
jgi:hypothetical protein